MHIYYLRPDENKYQNLVFLQESDTDILDSFDGTPFKDSWVPVEVQVFRDKKRNKKLPPSDFPSLSYHAPVFSQYAVDKLGDVLIENGELMPLICKEGDYFIYNITRLVDAIAPKKSKIERFENGRIMEIIEYAFIPERLFGLTIFKLPQTPKMDIFVTDDFVQRVREAKLTGFRFQKIWSQPTV